MNFGEIPLGALRGFPPGWISIHHLAGASHEKTSATITGNACGHCHGDGLHSSRGVSACFHCAGGGRVAWLSVGRAMVKLLGRSIPTTRR
jgi:hypothetical protein